MSDIMWLAIETNIQREREHSNQDLITSIVSRPSWTALSNRGNIVSRPGKPGGGFSEAFSSTVCGATNTFLLVMAHTTHTSQSIDNFYHGL